MMSKRLVNPEIATKVASHFDGLDPIALAEKPQCGKLSAIISLSKNGDK